MRLRSLTIGVCAVAAVALAVWAVARRGGAKPGSQYRTEAADRGPVSETVTATGAISAVTTVLVGSQVSGIIARLHADFNSPVKKGQLLAELDPTPFQLQVDQRHADRERAVVDMRNTEIAFHRQERLLKEGLAPQSDYDSAKAAYDGSKAQVDLAEASLRQAMTNLSYAKIYSPIDGVVVDREYDIGQTVAASFQAPTLFTIAEDLTKMRVQADVDQSDIGRVKVGQSARFTVDAYADQTFSGTISQIRLNATQNQNVITYPVIIDVPNPDGRLKPKMTADVTIDVAQVADVLRVPNAALRFQGDESGRADGEAGGSSAAGASAGGGRGAAADRAAGGFAGRGGRGRMGEGGGGVRAAEPAGAGSPGRAAGEAAADAPPGAAGGAGPAGAGGAAAAQALLSGGARPEARVFVLQADGSLRRVAVRTGISDGHYTAVLGGELEAGDRVVTGFSTAKVETTGSFPGMPGPAGGRGRR